MALEPKERKRLEISIIPLINVVFLLLIFFLVAGTAVDPNSEGMAFPQSDLGRTLPPPDIKLILKSEEEMLFEGEPVSLEALYVMVVDTVKTSPDALITLRAEADLPASILTSVLKQMTLAGATNISLATESLMALDTEKEDMPDSTLEAEDASS